LYKNSKCNQASKAVQEPFKKFQEHMCFADVFDYRINLGYGNNGCGEVLQREPSCSTVSDLAVT
jgi:hypothetical protein